MISIPCPVCSSKDYTLVATKADYTEDVCNVLCASCGLVYINPRSTEEELQAYYKEQFIQDRHQIADHEAAKERARLKGSERKYSAEGLKDGLTSSSRVLEIGCSYGFLLHVIQRAVGCAVRGVEPSGVSGYFAEREFGIPVFHGSVEEYLATPNEGPFDLIILYHVLEHVPYPVSVLARLRERLAPTGRLYVCVPDVTHLQEPLETFFQVPHLTSFSPWSLSRTLIDAGFVPTKLTRKLRSPKSGMELFARIGTGDMAELSGLYLIGKDPKAVSRYLKRVQAVYGSLRAIKRALARVVPAAFLERGALSVRRGLRRVFDRS